MVIPFSRLAQWLVPGALLLAVVARSPSPVGAIGLGDSASVEAQVKITDQGFQPTTVDVPQGAQVDLTFVFAQQAYPDDSHVIQLDGYDLETDQIDRDHPQSTLKFIANKAGTFGFSCANQCKVHDALQNGKLTVGASGAGTAASFAPTTLTLSPSTYATTGGPILLTAILTDAKGTPVSKSNLTFYEDATFGGVTGPMAIGTARTDANGVAFLYFQPTLDDPHPTITVKFAGGGVDGESAQSIHLAQAENPPPAYVTAPVGLAGLRLVAPKVFESAIALVWATLVLVLGLTVGVSFLSRRR